MYVALHKSVHLNYTNYMVTRKGLLGFAIQY